MNGFSLGTWIQVALNDIVCCHQGKGCMNFFGHRTKESHKSVHFPNTSLGGPEPTAAMLEGLSLAAAMLEGPSPLQQGCAT